MSLGNTRNELNLPRDHPNPQNHSRTPSTWLAHLDTLKNAAVTAWQRKTPCGGSGGGEGGLGSAHLGNLVVFGGVIG